jgi:type IV secretion system protein VirB3
MASVPRETIYKGATRPAMKFGIPLVPLVVVAGTAMLVVMWGGALLSWWVAAGAALVAPPLLVWMRVVTARDDQRLRQMFLATRLRLHDHNRRLWRARSYAPTPYRGADDGWRA